MNAPGTRPTYGVDRPGRVVAVIAIACFSLLLGLFFVGGTQSPFAGAAWFVIAVVLFAVGGAMIATSLVIKPRWWATTLDELALRGDERALDAGCGRGLVAIELARRLPDGQVVGIDAWRGRDQSGNGRVAAELNVQMCGLTERIAVADGDVRRLRFDDDSFDVVTASLLLGMLDPADRATALAELIRVLRPGGTLVVLDVGGAVPDDAALRTASLDGIRRRKVPALPRLTALLARR